MDLLQWTGAAGGHLRTVRKTGAGAGGRNQHAPKDTSNLSQSRQTIPSQVFSLFYAPSYISSGQDGRGKLHHPGRVPFYPRSRPNLGEKSRNARISGLARCLKTRALDSGDIEKIGHFSQVGPKCCFFLVVAPRRRHPCRRRRPTPPPSSRGGAPHRRRPRGLTSHPTAAPRVF